MANSITNKINTRFIALSVVLVYVSFLAAILPTLRSLPLHRVREASYSF
jgi:hypothetical protein